MSGVPSANPISSDRLFPATDSKKDPLKTMVALEWHGNQDIKVAVRPRPLVTEPKDAVIRMTTSTICGSDLHLFHNEFSGMKKGDVLGHECVGVIEQVGPEVHDFKVGDRVIVSAIIACGTCSFCQNGTFSCCDNTNPSTEMEKNYGHRIAALFGYSHLLGGYDGCQAEFVRVPFADVNLLKIPDTLSDEQVIFLSDIACTGWHATELGEVHEGQVVAVWGCGPVGLMAIAWSRFRGASRVIAIDADENRLRFAQRQFGAEIIDIGKEKVVHRIQELVPMGPDVCIDAAGFRFPKTLLHRIERAIGLETDSPQILNECIMACRKGGCISVVGDYYQTCNGYMIGAFMEKGLRMHAGQVHLQSYWKKLLGFIEEGRFDARWAITHTMPLDRGDVAYTMFDKHEDNCIKILLKPTGETLTAPVYVTTTTTTVKHE